MAAGVLTGDPVAGLKVPSDEDGAQQELEGLSDRELLREASREMLIASRLVFEVLQSQLPLLVQTKAMETATLKKLQREGLLPMKPRTGRRPPAGAPAGPRG
jgi:hypothetical protein